MFDSNVKNACLISLVLLLAMAGAEEECGDGVVTPPEECELPDTVDNEYCNQSTEQCGGGTLGNKVMYRDAYGNCDSLCGCVEDEWSDPVCEVGKCGAECDGLTDCENYCDGEVRYYDAECGWCWSCLCENYQSENCSEGDGWYETNATQWVQDGECGEKEQALIEYRTYSCQPEACEYAVTDSEWRDTGNANPQPEGTPCGEERDCPDSSCNGFLAEIYPPDGHDYCDGNLSCLVYSCEITDSYCSDNDTMDGVNGLTCGAECDQDSDCDDGNETTYDFCGEACSCEHEYIGYCGDGEVLGTEECELPGANNTDYCAQATEQCAGNQTQYRDEYGDCDSLCGCVEDAWSEPQCVAGSCGAECSVDADCDDNSTATIDSCSACMCEYEDAPYCGDGSCDSGENCDNCKSDCGCSSGYSCVSGKCTKSSTGGGGWSTKKKSSGGGGGVVVITTPVEPEPEPEEEPEPEPEPEEPEPVEEGIKCYQCAEKARIGKLFPDECPEGWTTEELRCWEVAEEMVEDGAGAELTEEEPEEVGPATGLVTSQAFGVVLPLLIALVLLVWFFFAKDRTRKPRVRL